MRSQKARNKIPRNRPKKVKRCWDGGNKVMFKSEEDAEAEIRYRSALHGGRRKVPKRSYKCDICHHWHITSMGEDDYAKVVGDG